MQAKMQEVEKRVKGYWWNDGLPELIGGAVLLLLAGYFVLTERLQDDSFWGAMLQSGFVVIMLGLIFGARHLIKWLKQRYVYPRTGFVEYRVEKDTRGHRRWMAAVMAALVAFIMVALTPLIGNINWVVAFTGVIIGVVLIFGKTRFHDIERFLYYGLVSIPLGIGAALTGWPNGYALGAYYGGMGALLVTSGLVVLVRFLSENPVAPEPDDEK